MALKFGMTVSEASEYTGIGRHTLRSLVRENMISPISIGQKELLLVKDLEEFMLMNRGMNLLDTANLRPVVPPEVRA